MSDDAWRAKLLEVVEEIQARCAHLSTRDKLDVLYFCWLLAAQDARRMALIEPGGFPAEKARQLEELNFLTAMVSSDEPDLEAERLTLEGDLDGLRRYVDQIRQQLAQEGLDPPDEKAGDDA